MEEDTLDKDCRDEYNEEEDYGDEIVDLGDDIQPFSMSFKPTA